MPVVRPARRGLVSNENDENSGTTRLTRAKAAAAAAHEDTMPTKATQSKKTALSVNAQTGQRKRPALGDVSNVTKVEINDGKKALGKSGLVSKAVQPTGIQKKTSASRTALQPKEANKKVEAKRSGSGAIGGVQKRKTTSSTSTVKKDDADEGEPLRKKVHSMDAEKKATKAADKENSHSKDPIAEPEPEPARPPTEYPPGVPNLDQDDIDDPLMVHEYAVEIFDYLRDLECNSIPNPQYMSHQDDLEWKTRGILIDWLIEVHTRFHLLPETLFLAVNIIDRFLSEKVVQLDRLQLVGITAMFIAAKYEEVISPHVSNFRHVADDGFSEDEILSAERFVLGALNFDLSYPNPMNFLRRISKADNYDIHTRTIGKYLMEISLLDHRFMGYRPSHIAAASMYLARMILDRGEWDETLAFYAGYTEEEIQPVFELMVDYLARPTIHEAFFKKYASKRFLKASILTRQWARKRAYAFGIIDVDLSLDQIS